MGCQLDSQYGFAAKCVPAAPAAPAQGTMKSTVDCADGRCAKTGQACSENDLNRCAGDSMDRSGVHSIAFWMIGPRICTWPSGVTSPWIM